MIRRAVKFAGPALLAVMLMGAGAGQIAVCHKGSDLSVSIMATFGHLVHGDRLGSYTPPPPPDCIITGACSPSQFTRFNENPRETLSRGFYVSWRVQVFGL